MASEEARARMRAAWTPERRAAQAERARAISYEDKRKGAVKLKTYWSTPERRRLKAKQASRQWTLEARRRASQTQLRCLQQKEYYDAWLAGMRRRLWDHWTPPRPLSKGNQGVPV